MLDTDGAILPTLFLAALYCYDRSRENQKETKRWILLLALALVTGLLVILSFVLVIGAFIADFLFEKRKELTMARLAYFGAIGAFVVILTGTAFVAVAFLNPAFRIDSMISHALYYVHWSGRSYLQVIIQAIKAIFYLSPLLIVPLFFFSIY